MKYENSEKTKGRPRAFDPDTALDKALEVFWNKGYEGATLPDLTAAMGINRPSLYATFGNKEELFRKALERYTEGTNSTMQEALAQPTAKEVAATLLHAVAGSACAASQPRGCLLVLGALVGNQETEPIRQELESRRRANEILLRERFERARREGDLPGHADPANLARFVTTVQHGLTVQAVSGATATEQQGVVAIALHSWPTP